MGSFDVFTPHISTLFIKLSPPLYKTIISHSCKIYTKEFLNHIAFFIIIIINYKGGNYMICSVNELKTKEVINVSDGARLGYVSDVEFDLATGQIISVILPGAYKMMGFLGREEDIIIKWNNIKKIGDDIIIIENLQ